MKTMGLIYNLWHRVVKQMVCKHIAKKIAWVY